MIRFVLAGAFLFLLNSAWAEEGIDPSGPEDDGSATSTTGEMKTTGGFVNMEPQTDYDAPIPDHLPSSDDDETEDAPDAPAG